MNVRNSTMLKKREAYRHRPDWSMEKKVRSHVNRLQTRIAKATLAARSTGCEMLERSAVKVARSVLRRGCRCNSVLLFDWTHSSDDGQANDTPNLYRRVWGRW